MGEDKPAEVPDVDELKKMIKQKLQVKKGTNSTITDEDIRKFIRRKDVIL